MATAGELAWARYLAGEHLVFLRNMYKDVERAFAPDGQPLTVSESLDRMIAQTHAELARYQREGGELDYYRVPDVVVLNFNGTGPLKTGISPALVTQTQAKRDQLQRSLLRSR